MKSRNLLVCAAGTTASASGAAATVEGVLYYAFRDSNNRARGAPSLSMQTAIWPKIADDACVFTEMAGTNRVVDLIPREGLLWLVQHDKDSLRCGDQRHASQIARRPADQESDDPADSHVSQ